MLKPTFVLMIIGVLLIIAQPIINTVLYPIPNIKDLESTEGVRQISVQSKKENLTLKILVENDLSEQEARNITEEVINKIDVEDKKIIFSLLYEHGYLIGQGTFDTNEREIRWN